MYSLEKLKPSLLELSEEQQLLIHQEVRKNRLITKVPNRKKHTVKKKIKKFDEGIKDLGLEELEALEKKLLEKQGVLK